MRTNDGFFIEQRVVAVSNAAENCTASFMPTTSSHIARGVKLMLSMVKHYARSVTE